MIQLTKDIFVHPSNYAASSRGEYGWIGDKHGKYFLITDPEYILGMKLANKIGIFQDGCQRLSTFGKALMKLLQ
jgi:hypothetical protein